jgi:hypothetical protein
MKTYTNHLGHRFIDFKNSIETNDTLKRLILIRWWINTFEKTWSNLGEGFYYKEKRIGDISYCMMIDMNILDDEKKGKLMFDCYYHNQTKIKEEERDTHFFFEEDIKDYTLDKVYELYKQGLKQWEKHLKNFATN